MQVSQILNNFKIIALETYDAFFEDRIFKLSGALAYYTILAISPIILIIISVSSLLYKKEAIENRVFNELKDLIGSDLAQEVQTFVINSSLTGKDNIALISGVVILFVLSTAVFAEMQDSLNLIWKIKPKPKIGWFKIVKDRIISFSVIITLAFIMLVSTLLTALIKRFGRFFYDNLPEFNQAYDIIFSVINFIVGFLMPVIVFTLIFKILADIKMKWKPAFVGGLFTAVLFTIGQYLLGIYFKQFQPGLNYGSASSIITLLIWVYYTSIILYIGAEFTQSYAENFSTGIQPNQNAVKIKISEEIKPKDKGRSDESVTE